MGHYAMPLLWGAQMLGWANVAVVNGRLEACLGFAAVASAPPSPAFQPALDQAIASFEVFMGL